MNAAQPPSHRTLFFVVSAILIVLGFLSAADVGNQTYIGYFDDGNNHVIHVDSGSPAALAGMRVGDVVTSVNGVAVSDTKGILAMHRPAIGETRPYVVQRGGQSITLPIKATQLLGRDVLAARAASFLGLCFLGFTLWAYLAAPSASTLMLAIFGLMFGLGFLGVPYFEDAMVRTIANQLITAIILLGTAVIVHYLLAFPSRGKFLDRSNARAILYLPAVLVAVVNIVFTLANVPSTSGVNVFFRTLFGLTFGVYFIAALWILVRRYLATPPTDRVKHGLPLMVVGAIVGLGPLMISIIANVLLPSVSLPGSQYYFLTLGLIPIAFALAAVKSARMTTA